MSYLHLMQSQPLFLFMNLFIRMEVILLYLMDQVKDKKNKEDSWVESIALKEAMEHLPDREYDIIKMRFFEGKTQTEVATKSPFLRHKSAVWKKTP